MRFDENAQLDTSGVDDLRGSGGGGGGGGIGGRVAAGGGGLGVVGLILYFVLSQFAGVDLGGIDAGGGYGGLSNVSAGQTADSSQLQQSCRTGAAANNSTDCQVVAVLNSLDSYWSDSLSRSGTTFERPRTNFFDGGVNTGGCGNATSDTGPFYCPADSEIYIDLAFFQELTSRFGTQGGPFAQAYVIAHEYGHHIQNVLGTNRRVGNDTGPTSGSVRLELQADCYAGVWANHATTTPGASGRPLITELNQEDVDAALDTAAKIGDDYIQTNLGNGRVDESQFSHGSSAQREKWFTTGIQSGDPARCDTFATRNLG